MGATLERDDARDRELARRAARGDLDSFSELVSHYGKPLYNAAYRITHSSADAEDVVQLALLRAYERIDTFDPERRFFSWIFKIVVNEALRWSERESTLSRRLEEQSREVLAGPRWFPAAAAAVEAQQRLGVALGRLSADHRAVVVLRHLHGLSYAEMAEVLDLPLEKVRSRLFSARERLRRELDAER